MKAILHPQEIEVWYVLPAIRRELVLQFKQQGIKQKEIAKILRITEPAVSQYINQKRAKLVEFDSKINKQIHKAAIKIIKQKSCIIKEIQQICKKLRKDGQLCKIHRQKDKNVSAKCAACRN